MSDEYEFDVRALVGNLILAVLIILLFDVQNPGWIALFILLAFSFSFRDTRPATGEPKDIELTIALLLLIILIFALFIIICSDKNFSW